MDDTICLILPVRIRVCTEMLARTLFFLRGRTVGKVPLSKWLMNRPVRSRMQGGVGRAGEKLALTRLCF